MLHPSLWQTLNSRLGLQTLFFILFRQTIACFPGSIPYLVLECGHFSVKLKVLANNSGLPAHTKIRGLLSSQGSHSDMFFPF